MLSILKSFETCCLPWYYEMFTARHVKSVIEFSELDWTKIYTNLKKEYKD